MTVPLFLDAFAALLPSGRFSAHGHVPWDPGQRGPDDVSRDQVLKQPYPGFGKLHLADRLAFGVASLLFDTYETCAGDDSGITLGNPSGSFSTDLLYRESVTAGFPSPAVFSATLPSSPIADIAIFYGLKGPDRVIAGNSGSGLCAFECAVNALLLRKATTMLAVILNAVEPEHRPSPLAPKPLQRENYAYAFLLTSQKRVCGLHYRLDVSLRIPETALADCPGEPYFYDLLRMLAEGRSGIVSVETAGYTGHISLEKDA